MSPDFEAVARKHGIRLAADLQRCFPGGELDLAVINRADPLFLARIVNGCRLLYGAPRALAELKIYAFKRYQGHRQVSGDGARETAIPKRVWLRLQPLLWSRR